MMPHAVLYRRIHVADAFLDLMFISTKDSICFPFHLGCQEADSKVQCLR